MQTELSLNRNAEIAKFFIEEASQFGKSRGTQTYVPLQILLEILRKESVKQGEFYRGELRSLLLD